MIKKFKVNNKLYIFKIPNIFNIIKSINLNFSYNVIKYNNWQFYLLLRIKYKTFYF